MKTPEQGAASSICGSFSEGGSSNTLSFQPFLLAERGYLGAG